MPSTTRLGMSYKPAPPTNLPPLTASRTSYSDSEYEYRHVQLPKTMLKVIPTEYHDKAKGTLKLLWEEEWRAMGITQVSLAHRSNPPPPPNSNK